MESLRKPSTNLTRQQRYIAASIGNFPTIVAARKAMSRVISAHNLSGGEFYASSPTSFPLLLSTVPTGLATLSPEDSGKTHNAIF